jgi:NADPH:quinone reductase-like Zn-dependent oxidoreductase
MSSSLPSTSLSIHIPKFISSAELLSTLQPTSQPLSEPGENAILIRTSHVSPTHVDVLYAQGLHQNNRTIAKPPFTLGTDFAGVILSAPKDSGFKQGDEVYGSCFGAFTEYITVVQGFTGAIRRVPKGWTSAEACAMGSSGAISLGCFLRVAGGASAIKDEWVLVTGATGGLGTAACQIAAYLGGKVIALVGDDVEKEDMIKSLNGVRACVKYSEKGWEKKVIEIADGQGVNMVYDSVGMVESGLRCCKFGGTVVIVGFAGRGGQMEALRMNRILLKGAGVLGYRFGEHSRRAPAEVAEIWNEVDEMVQIGALKSVVYQPKQPYLGLQDVPRALDDLHHRKVWGRAVIALKPEDASQRSKI